MASELIYTALCITGAVLGTFLKIRAYKQDTGHKPDKTEHINLMIFSAAAGLVIGLIGKSLHLQTSFLMGISIIVGYAGGRHFFDLAVKAAKKAAESKIKEITETGISNAVEKMKDVVGDDKQDTKK